MIRVDDVKGDDEENVKYEEEDKDEDEKGGRGGRR